MSGIWDGPFDQYLKRAEVARMVNAAKPTDPEGGVLAYKITAITTTFSLATTTTKATVNATDLNLNFTPPASASAVLEVGCHYDFSAADSLFWQITIFGIGDTGLFNVGYFPSGWSGFISRKIVIPKAATGVVGLTAGVPASLRLKHFSLINASATAKMGGTSGAARYAQAWMEARKVLT